MHLIPIGTSAAKARELLKRDGFDYYQYPDADKNEILGVKELRFSNFNYCVHLRTENGRVADVQVTRTELGSI